MLPILLKTLPFFAMIGLGYWAGRTRFFTEEATAYLTKFVFYFALSAMLFRFTANLELAEVWDTRLVLGYLWATAFVYGIATAVAFLRGLSVAEAAVEAQCAAIGNVGFLGIPMLRLLLGDEAVGVIVIILTVDLVVFSSLIVILITGSRDGRMSFGILRTVGSGLIRNPMIVAVVLGFAWSSVDLPIPGPMNEFLGILGAAATPGALFAIGASLASPSPRNACPSPSGSALPSWFCTPAFVAVALILLFPVDSYTAAVAVSAAALPVAGNVYILAQHYGVAPQRVSAAILVSTAASILTVTAVLVLVH
jgi:malonate transporter and related proteins